MVPVCFFKKKNRQVSSLVLLKMRKFLNKGNQLYKFVLCLSNFLSFNYI
jgi:hypothetical protein